MSRIKSTETTISCRISKADKDAFLKIIGEYDELSNEPYKFRPGTVLRTLIRAYTNEPEKMQMFIAQYR